MPKHSNKKNFSRALLIWDCEDDYPIENQTILWKSYAPKGLSHIHSIPQIVDENANILRKKYLAWIYNFGKCKVQGKRVVDWLEIQSGFNYWWMTLLIEKSYGKSSVIYDSIRLMAFDDWLKYRHIKRINLKTDNPDLVGHIEEICKRLNITFNSQLIKKELIKSSRLRFLYKKLPNALKAVVWLMRYVINRQPLRNEGLKKLQFNTGNIIFFSYLFNLNSEELKKGNFESFYWAHLPDFLKRKNYKINWIHIYARSEQIPTSKKAAEIIRRFNKTGGNLQNHLTLDAFLSWKVIFRTLFDWFKLISIGFNLKNDAFKKKESDINLWSIHENDWKNSIFGVVAMQNLLSYNLLKAMLEILPYQSRGLYLQENQSWEFALIQLWKKLGYGELIGVPHSTIRFWDLRYFFDPKSYSKEISYKLPMPNKVALNGPFAIKAYKEGGYPPDDLAEVEALRYMYLLKSKLRNISFKKSSNKKNKHILVLGDFLVKNTEWQMSMLEAAVIYLPANTTFTVKPHPGCLIDPNDYPKIKMVIDNSPIEKLIAACDIVFTGAATSAVVDAFSSGVPVISALDPEILNLNPLRGWPGVIFVKSPEELSKALKINLHRKNKKITHKKFFTLDFGLFKWQKLFGLN